MKLRDLEGQLLKRHEDGSMSFVETVAEADGVMFLCPKCFEKNQHSNVGVHNVICWFAGKVPDSVSPGPGRWVPQGTTLDDLTFISTKEHPKRSVFLNAQHNGKPVGCQWHGFVTNGDAK